jgi:hypothetical protein
MAEKEILLLIIKFKNIFLNILLLKILKGVLNLF